MLESLKESAVTIDRPLAAYIHVPFCAHKCGYCDFASVAGQDELADAYLEALDLEMASILPTDRLPMRTIFIGGGTPTYLSAGQLEKLLARLAQRFDLESVVEFTVESNPNTLSTDKVDVLADFGVNRISLGAQSFHPHLLQVLERNHDPQSVPRAVECVRRRIDNVSLDLIFGVPGQTLSEWKQDLDRMLALQPQHCSTYGLTYEKGTRLWSQRRLGVVQQIDEEIERAMYEHAIDHLQQLGWIHYEISNFAKDDVRDYRCLHNLNYWCNGSYFGFGTGAAAYVRRQRTLNIRDVKAYISRCNAGESVVSQSETLDPESRARETAMLQLRRLQGIDRSEFLMRTGYAIDQLFGDQLQHFVEIGFLADDGSNIRLTREGLPLADGILQAVV